MAEWAVANTRDRPTATYPARQRALYREFTAWSIATLAKAQLLTLVREAIAIQHRVDTGFPPHIVFMAHPWEFEPTEGLTYASENNWQKLAEFIATVAKVYPVRLSSISDLVALRQPLRTFLTASATSLRPTRSGRSG